LVVDLELIIVVVVAAPEVVLPVVLEFVGAERGTLSLLDLLGLLGLLSLLEDLILELILVVDSVALELVGVLEGLSLGLNLGRSDIVDGDRILLGLEGSALSTPEAAFQERVRVALGISVVA